MQNCCFIEGGMRVGKKDLLGDSKAGLARLCSLVPTDLYLEEKMISGVVNTTESDTKDLLEWKQVVVKRKYSIDNLTWETARPDWTLTVPQDER